MYCLGACDYGVGFESVTVNGVSVELDEDGDFEFPLAATHGLNTVELVARSLAGDALPGPTASTIHGLRRASGNETELEDATLGTECFSSGTGGIRRL